MKGKFPVIGFVKDPTAAAALYLARELVNKGHSYAGAIPAAVAFEGMMRTAADLLQIGPAIPLSGILSELDRHLYPGERDQLQTLIRIRNGLVHGKYENLNNYEAEDLVDAFYGGTMRVDELLKRLLR